MTRFLPIDRPLVYGDIVSYQPGTNTGDRNIVLCPQGRFKDMYSMIQITMPSGEVEIEFIPAFKIGDSCYLVEE